MASGSFRLLQAGPADISFGLQLGLQHFAARVTAGVTSLGFDVFPVGRATFHLLDKLEAYGELGLGLTFYSTTYQVPFTGYQSAGASGGGFRLGGGLSYALNDRVRLYLEPVGLLVASVTSSVTVQGQTYTASATGSQWSLLLGANYHL